ncbi:cytochrome c oxidase assembly protein, partial [Streptomyces sp. NPDC006333]
DIHAPIDQVQAGAEIMYYGGDIAELLLAAALVTTWHPAPRPRRDTTTVSTDTNAVKTTPLPQ